VVSACYFPIAYGRTCLPTSLAARNLQHHLGRSHEGRASFWAVARLSVPSIASMLFHVAPIFFRKAHYCYKRVEVKIVALAESEDARSSCMDAFNALRLDSIWPSRLLSTSVVRVFAISKAAASSSQNVQHSGMFPVEQPSTWGMQRFRAQSWRRAKYNEATGCQRGI